jgi:hypothetical protein
MKTKLKSIVSLVAAVLVSATGFSQTTAMNFSGVDCNGNAVDLFSDLDAGKAVVLFFYMPNCGSCPPPAQKIQTMANNINATDPGRVKAYSFPYQNSTTCAYSSSWVTSNNLSLYAPMDSGAVQVAYYGGFGMPTVVLLGGDNRDVLFVTQDFNTSDTTTMRDLILGMSSANTSEVAKDEFKLEVFPNPGSDLLHISFSAPAHAETFIDIVDANGKLVFSTDKEVSSTGKIEKQINVSRLESGSYFVNLNINGIVTKQKVNIVH